MLLFRGRIKRVADILPFLILTAVSSVYEFIFSFILKIDVKIWFTIYCIFEFATIFYFFFRLNYPKYKFIFSLFLLCYLAIFPNVFLINNSDHHFFNLQALQSGNVTLFVCVMSFLWFYDTFRKMEIPSLWKSPEFYYISGLLIYHCTTFFLFLLSEVLFKNHSEHFMDYWAINIVANLFLRFLLSIGVWKAITK